MRDRLGSMHTHTPQAHTARIRENKECRLPLRHKKERGQDVCTFNSTLCAQKRVQLFLRLR